MKIYARRRLLNSGDLKSFCRDELPDWPTPRLVHRSAPCRKLPVL
jgi:hypothetical protein